MSGDSCCDGVLGEAGMLRAGDGIARRCRGAEAGELAPPPLQPGWRLQDQKV